MLVLVIPNNPRFDTYYGRKSKELLWSQNKNDKPEYLKYRTKRGQQYKLGLDSTGVVYGENDKWGLGTYYILAACHKREVIIPVIESIGARDGNYGVVGVVVVLVVLDLQA
jgi:hypothetical protein